MEQEQDDGAWFSPKRFGYGAGLPITWKGWAFMAIHIAVITLGMTLLRNNALAAMAWALLIGLGPMPLYAAKTRGGWKWRSGERD